MGKLVLSGLLLLSLQLAVAAAAKEHRATPWSGSWRAVWQIGADSR